MELLSPAGGFDSLKAAVENGADAVYIGAQKFSARGLSQNFDDLAAAANYAHDGGAKLYLAMNTLIRDREIASWLQTAQEAVHAGVDAFIIQDLGCAMLLKELCPSAVLHASTQMTAYSLSGVSILEKLGFSRVVLARELTFKQICDIRRQSSIPLEVFVHGALCESYSGQCLMSSIFGGRSANRGLCAQPCRLDYSADGVGHGRLLSPRDLCLIDYIDQLRQAGVASIKIEGRMKPAAYVGTVTRIYRKALDGAKITVQDKEDLLRAFSRRGFTDRPFSQDIPVLVPGGSIASEPSAPPKSTLFKEYVPLKKGKRKKPRKLAAQVNTEAQAVSVLPFVDILYVPYEAAWVSNLPETDAKIIGTHPLIIEENHNCAGCHNFEGELFATLLDADVPHKISDASIHVTNGQTLKALKALGYERATISVELNSAQIVDLPDLMPTEVIAYGRLTLMTTIRCPLRCDKKQCKVKSGGAVLTDRMNKNFPLVSSGNGCMVSILNSAPVYMADKLSQISANVIRLVFTTETPAESKKIATIYRDALRGIAVPPPTGEFTRGHFTRGML
ncbi:MAG: U32 family peptidase [Christensenella sp.]|nr:U32 family peptidase [Christensenella sp.]